MSKRVARRYRRKTINVNKALQPVAQRTIVKMKYSEVVSGQYSPGISIYRFNLNSIFDPNRTGIGHQPYGHDTFQTLYNRYRVINCKYIVSAYSNSGATIQFACLPANEEFIQPTVSEYRENPRCKYTVQTPGAPLRFLKGNVYIPSLVGRSKSQYMADDRYQSMFGASPAELAILNCAASIYQETASDSQIFFNVTLVYTVECFDVKNLNQS